MHIRIFLVFYCLFFSVFLSPAYSEYLATGCWIDSEGDYLELAVSSTDSSEIFTAVGTSYDSISRSPVIGNIRVNENIVDGVLTISGRNESGIHFDTIGSMRLNLDTLNGDWLATTRLYDASLNQIQLSGKNLEFTFISCDQLPEN